MDLVKFLSIAYFLTNSPPGLGEGEVSRLALEAQVRYVRAHRLHVRHQVLAAHRPTVAQSAHQLPLELATVAVHWWAIAPATAHCHWPLALVPRFSDSSAERLVLWQQCLRTHNTSHVPVTNITNF